MDVIDEIDRLSRRRQELRLGGEAEDLREVDRITSRLADLYEQKRHEAAQSFGSRAEIVRRARVESELERLMADRGR